MALFISACGPTYVTKNEYAPPTNPAGVSCLQRCEVKRSSCQNSCNHKNQICRNKAAQKAKQTLPAQLSEYTNQLETYTVEQDRYHAKTRERRYELKQLEMDYGVYKDRCSKDKHYCDRKKEIKRKLNDLKYSRIESPSRPSKPTLASETTRHEASCTTSCGCDSLYDGCYTSCGGRIIPRQICTSNCPDKKKI